MKKLFVSCVITLISVISVQSQNIENMPNINFTPQPVYGYHADRQPGREVWMSFKSGALDG